MCVHMCRNNGVFEIFSNYISATDDWRCYKPKGLKQNIVENIEQIALFFSVLYLLASLLFLLTVF